MLFGYEAEIIPTLGGGDSSSHQMAGVQPARLEFELPQKDKATRAWTPLLMNVLCRVCSIGGQKRQPMAADPMELCPIWLDFVR